MHPRATQGLSSNPSLTWLLIMARLENNECGHVSKEEGVSPPPKKRTSEEEGGCPFMSLETSPQQRVSPKISPNNVSSAACLQASTMFPSSPQHSFCQPCPIHHFDLKADWSHVFFFFLRARTQNCGHPDMLGFMDFRILGLGAFHTALPSINSLSKTPAPGREALFFPGSAAGVRC